MAGTTHRTLVSSIIIVITLLTTLTASLHITSAAPSSLRGTQQAHHHFAATYLPLSEFGLRGMNGPYHTEDNHILGADNHPYLFHGIARDDLEYFCKGDGHYSERELAYMSLGNTTAQETYWGANTVRLPLSEN